MAHRKILSFKALSRLVAELRLAGKKIVYAQGFFDLLHVGHVHHLKQAKKLGEVLIVGVVADRFNKKGPGRPLFKEQERLKLVAALECVDFVVLNEAPDAIGAIEKILPDIYAKGEDVKANAVNRDKKLYWEIEVLNVSGGKVYFTKSLPIHSSELLAKFSDAKLKNKKYGRTFKSR